MNWNAEQIAAADRDQLHCFNYNHYVFARRQGSTLAPIINTDSHRTVCAECPMRVVDDLQATCSIAPMDVVLVHLRRRSGDNRGIE